MERDRQALEIAVAATDSAVHKVEAPPPTTSLEKMKTRVKETFFPDDPFRHFKGQPPRRKCVLGLRYLFPVLDWLPYYNLSFFKSDLIAGLTIASLAIPQGISYAKLANLPPIIGLYTSFVPPLVYSVLGSSRDLAVGPVSIASLIMGAMLRQAVNPNTDPNLFLQLAFTATLFAGVFQASLGILRLGFIIDFLSKATLVGFMAGAAIIVSLQQLKNLLGIVHFTKEMSVVPVMASVFHNVNEWSWQTVAMGIAFLGFLLVARYVGMKRPKLFWLSVGSPLASVIISTLIVFLVKAQNHGISIIGNLKCGLNSPSWNKLVFDKAYLSVVIKTGLTTGIISLTEGIASGRTFAALRGYQVDGNKEMMAIGLMNVVGSCTSCYVSTGAFSRSAVNHNAGCKTAMSNIVMALTVMITLLFLMPLFAYTPNVVLASIIIAAVIGLVDVPTAFQIWKLDKVDFVVCLSSFLGVIFISVQEGLAIAVGLSIFRILLQTTRPKIVELGNILGTNIYRDIHQYRDAKGVAGFLILAIEAPINFSNTTYLKERMTRWIEEEKSMNEKELDLQYVILDLSGVPTVDTSGISFLIDLKKTASKFDLELIFINPLGEVMEKLQRANKMQGFLGVNSLYLTIHEAVFSCTSFLAERKL
ncbi:probable sulfate transporter 3.3 [Zingiber officinale]|uniref:probable sulfate transporter 3.3 n=1 Tax=Zingiber officinale TaxID=94328 RepID=UPI001C4D2534|nr:probable sulfate transporter 3.3 [Zingiber officinale]